MIKIERKQVTIAELRNAHDLCCWDGCNASYQGVQPPGWQIVIKYHALRPEIHKWTAEEWAMKSYQDFVLCPAHAVEFGKLLKNLRPAVMAPAQGSA